MLKLVAAELMGTLARQESRESLSSDHSSSRDDQDDQWLSQVRVTNVLITAVLGHTLDSIS